MFDISSLTTAQKDALYMLSIDGVTEVNRPGTDALVVAGLASKSETGWYALTAAGRSVTGSPEFAAWVYNRRYSGRGE